MNVTVTLNYAEQWGEYDQTGREMPEKRYLASAALLHYSGPPFDV